MRVQCKNTETGRGRANCGKASQGTAVGQCQGVGGGGWTDATLKDRKEKEREGLAREVVE